MPTVQLFPTDTTTNGGSKYGGLSDCFDLVAVNWGLTLRSGVNYIIKTRLGISVFVVHIGNGARYILTLSTKILKQNRSTYTYQE